ncbi:MAG: lysophospholipase [Woeseiaceae bacterium]|nr:lysophospholipase [Woeseiaceae bacterium]
MIRDIRSYKRFHILLAGLLLCLHWSTALAAERVRHTVLADGHPLALWEKSATAAEEAVLLVHGRTWSAIPDFDLQVEGEDLSLMDGLVAHGYAVYAVDLRGYGESPRDDTGWLTPDRAAADIGLVLEWIAEHRNYRVKPHLFGWSMGSTNALLLAQRRPELIASLTLFGFWYDLDTDLPADEPGITPQRLRNTAEAAASDFITPGSISRKAIDAYVTVSLAADPVKTDLRHNDHYNALDPAKVATPTLVIQGEFDPIAPTDYQQKLYTRLGTGHKQWVSVPGGDHAAFMETPRAYFIDELVTFMNGASDRAGAAGQAEDR